MTDTATTTTTTTKHCPGFANMGLPEHDAPLSAFGANKSRPDGLSYHCTACGSTYGRAWSARQRAIAKAEAMGPGEARDQAMAAAYALPPLTKPRKPDAGPLLPEPATALNTDAPATVIDGSYGTPPVTTLPKAKNVTPKALPAAQEAIPAVSPLRAPDAYQAGLVANEPREQWVAKMAQQPGWTTTTVAGAAYPIPTDAAQVETPEGQEALAAVQVAKRAMWAQAKRDQSARAKAAAKAAATA